MKKKPAKLYADIQSDANDVIKARQRKRPRLPFPKHWKSWRLVKAGEALLKDDLVWPISLKNPRRVGALLDGKCVNANSAYLSYGFYYRRTK